MLSKLREQREEEGFTLIELLVVVIIIGILAAIAIPVFLNQRESAWRNAVESDLRNAAIQIETVLTREGSFPNGFTVAPLDDERVVELTVGTGDEAEETGIVVTVSGDVGLVYALDEGSTTTYTIIGTHENLEGELTYDSDGGGLANASWEVDE